LWSADDLNGTVESSFQRGLSVKVCCDLIGDLLSGTFVLGQRLSTPNYSCWRGRMAV
jgi:hypothetical protein